MGTIKVLDRLLSDMIAAGEVVERPASVVKELFENATDAHAGRITVEIENGGKSLISVTDDGCGMDREDAVLSVVRYATSKLSSKEDLFDIRTMGFRGEALASISAVSKVTIITRKEDSVSGTKLVCEGGEVVSVEETGCPVGTKITVENLFYNTPARLKFLKKDATEAAYIEEMIARLILANPAVSIKFIKDGRQIYYSKGDNDVRSAVYAVYGNQLSDNLIAVSKEENGVTVSGYVGSPNLARPTRKFEHFSINGRICRSKILYSALEYAYFQKMAQGKYPFCALDIRLDYHLCDVNVHPQKAEVKFSEETYVYDALLHAVREALEKKLFVKETNRISLSVSQVKPYREESELKNYQQSSFVKEKTPQETKHQPIFNQVNDFTFLREKSVDSIITKTTEAVKKDIKTELKPTVPVVKTETAIPVIKETVATVEQSFSSETDQKNIQEIIKSPEEVVSNPEEIHSQPEEIVEDFRVIGQVFSSYIILDRRDEMLLLDQHAAHERINYEKIHQEFVKKEIASQILMVPKLITMAPSDYRLALEHLELFSNVGMLVEDFNDNTLVIREIPCEVKERHVEKLVYEILEEIRRSGKVLPENFNQRLLFLVACKMSVKANTELSEYQMTELVKQAFLLNGKTTCPHGRPLFVSFSKTYVETKFER